MWWDCEDDTVRTLKCQRINSMFIENNRKLGQPYPRDQQKHARFKTGKDQIRKLHVWNE